MNIATRLIRSSLGKKYLMALTGAGLFVFVIGHMLGNLQIFLGPEAINRYAAFLQGNKELLWMVRVGLLVCLVIHVWSSIALTIENRSARGRPYEVKKAVDASLASRTMIWSGAVVFAFVAYHLAHFTLMVTHPEYRDLHDEMGRHDVYRMMVLGFQQPVVSLVYLVGVGLLCWHLSHGVAAMCQSLGLRNESYAVWIKRFAKGSAWVLFAGYAVIPLAVWAGVVK